MRRAIFILIFIISSGFIPRAVFGYSGGTTHPALTSEVINFYNSNFDKKITDEQRKWILEGSTEEDTPPRWVNHFYDPVYNEGWTGEHGNAYLSENFMKKFSDMFLSSEGALSAIDWVHNQEVQEKYKFYKGNQTWEKALYEYVQNKNEREAFLALGHVLHLLEDMAVPDHTRNDTHPGDSPYENYCAQFTVDNFFIVGELKAQNYLPKNFDSLDGYFKNLAEYSNGYFFSKDTINDPKYNKPKILGDDGEYGYGLDADSISFKLTKVRSFYIKEGNKLVLVKGYIIEDRDEYKPILQAYWTRLSREAVLYGAGVIDLFFKEAEKAKNDPTLLQAPPQTGSLIFSFFGEFTRAKTVLADTRSWISNQISSAKNTFLSILSSPNVPVGGGTAGLSRFSDFTETQPPAENSAENPANESDLPEAQTYQEEIPIQQPALEEAGPKLASQDSEQDSEWQPFWEPMVPAPFGAGGGGSAGVSVDSPSFVPETELESEPGPELEPKPETELEPEPDPEPRDTTPPDISLAVAECENSMSPDTCLLATTTLNILWFSPADDLDFFELTINGNIFSTTSTSTVFIAEDNSSNNFSIRAKDIEGNWSDPQNISAQISLNPVVINEVAWGGTNASPYDEWIELYNKTSAPVSLENWILYSETDMGPYITLSGVIPAKGYYLIERTDDSTVSDIPADLVSSFGSGLNNSGEILILSYASTTVDQTVLCGTGPCRWCPGFDYKNYSMERIDPFVAGTEYLNWSFNIGLIRNGLDADGNSIAGTPKARNSRTYYIVQDGNTLKNDKVLTKENSPYFVHSSLVVQKGVTLSIEPGVVIKFYQDTGMMVGGRLVSSGSADDPVVFTSFYDDEYGGDLNGDATTTIPGPGNWFEISFPDYADSGSVFDHTIVRYGGKWYNGVGNSQSNIYIQGVDVEISNSVSERAVSYGLKLVNSNSQIKNNIFRYNSASGGATGILIEGGGEPIIENNDFIENMWGLMIISSRPSVVSNNFVGNSRDAVNTNGPLGVFQDNYGSGNGLNAIKISGQLTAKETEATLYPNAFPYIAGHAPDIAASSTLFVRPGVVVKGEIFLIVYGNLVAEGISPGDILFTSVSDDLIGSSTPGYWGGIRAMPGSSVTLKGATVRRGSAFVPGSTTAGLYAENAEVSLADTIFENGREYGLYLFNSTSAVENSVFRNHTESLGAQAISYHGSPISLKNVSFSNNLLAIYADTNSMVETIENLIFENNYATTSPEGLF